MDPFEEELENTNILDFFKDVERTSLEEKWDWGALARGDTSGKHVLDLLQEGHDESVIDHRGSTAQYEEEMRAWQKIARWHDQETKMDRQAMVRREGEERRMMLHFREQVSDALVSKAGSPLKAYKAFDHNCSGRVSMNEFEAGMRTLGVKWEEITGFGSIRELFRLFDFPLTKDASKDDDDQIRRPKGYLTFGDLFPLDAKNRVDPARMSTPDFWSYWCSRNKNVSPKQTRPSRWDTAGSEEKLAEYKRREAHRERTEERKQWMRGMIHRLKHNGKSDARCREIVALHLPRGSGPRNLEDVQTFSKNEVRACRKTYVDKVQESVRKTEARVSEMHKFRTTLRTAKQQLYQTTEEPHVRAKLLEDNRTSLMQLGGGLGGLFKREHHDEEIE
jgi:hypothetical protein